MGNNDHRNAPTELFCGSMVLDLLVKTSGKTKNKAVEESCHRDVAFGSNFKMPVDPISDQGSSSTCDISDATVFSTSHSTSTFSNWSTLVVSNSLMFPGYNYFNQ